MKVLHRIRLVLILPPPRSGVLEIIQCRPHSPGNVKTPGDTHCTYGVQAITILKNSGLKGERFEASRVAVGFDCMRHLLDALQGPAHISQD
ncbi:hypothetical protein D3C72_1692420 [compost metagenome]